MREQSGGDGREGRGRMKDEIKIVTHSFLDAESTSTPLTHFNASGTVFAHNPQQPVHGFGDGGNVNAGYGAAGRSGESGAQIKWSHGFFTGPLSKLMPHGHFSGKLLVNLLMLLFIFLIGIMYHIPNSIATESKRKAVLGHFIGDDYLGKDKGDIVLRPTIYLDNRQDVLDHIRNFVKVYYEISNTSLSEFLYYYYYSQSQEGVKNMCKLFPNEYSERINELHTTLLERDSDDSDTMPNFKWIQPVTMELDVFLYSPQEHYGASPSRYFTFTLTEDDELGPFKYDEKQSAGESISGGRLGAVRANNILNSKARRHLDKSKRGISGTSLRLDKKFSTHEEGNVAAACAPRLDTISMQYYSPCRGTVDDGVERFSPLLGNTRSILLRATLLHLSHSDVSSVASDFTAYSTVLYHWSVEKRFQFHEGGVVEVTFSAALTKQGLNPKIHVHLILSAALIVLACVDVAIRIRAMSRILAWRKIANTRQEHCDRDESESRCQKLPCDSVFDLSRSATTNRLFVSSLHSPSGECFIDAINESEKVTNSANSQALPSTPFARQVACDSSANKRNSPGDTSRTIPPKRKYTDFHDIHKQHLQRSQGEEWQYVYFVTDAVVVVYGIMSIKNACGLPLPESYEVYESIFLGVSGLLLCVGLLSYLRYFPEVYFTVRATREVIPRLLAFALTIMPFFVGFGFFFFIVFGCHSKGEFADIGSTLVGLYFVMYGDAILPAIADANGSVHVFVNFLANAMTVLFVFFFMMTMLNLAMSITHQEWRKMRGRLGACLSEGSILFTVRTREQVKLETTQSIIADLELLLHIRREEEMRENASIPQAEGGNADELHDGGTEGNGSIDSMSGNFRE